MEVQKFVFFTMASMLELGLTTPLLGKRFDVFVCQSCFRKVRFATMVSPISQFDVEAILMSFCRYMLVVHMHLIFLFPDIITEC